MDIVHTTITFKDTFSHAKVLKQATVSKHTFDSMQKDVGKIVHIFDKNKQINYNFKITKVEQSKP